MSNPQFQPGPAIPWFIATEKFDKFNPGWGKYIAWSGLKQLDEIVSLDASLCTTLLPNIKTEYWDHIMNEGYMLHFFTDLNYLLGQIVGFPRRNLLCVFRNPFRHPTEAEVPQAFEFVGYDLVDRDSQTSALTNCRGFPKAFANEELSPKGLICSHERAREIQEALTREYPSEHHADCHLWAIFRDDRVL